MKTLQPAAERGDLETLTRLLSAGHDPNERDANGMLPLYAAARMGQLEALELLLARDADPRGRIKDGHTPLHAIAGVGCPKCVEALLAAGADPNALSIKEWTEAELAETKIKMAEFQKEMHQRVPFSGLVGAKDEPWKPEPGPPPLIVAVTRGDVDTVRLLLKAGAKTEGPGNRIAPLSLVASTGNTAMMEVFLENGADPNQIDDDSEMSLAASAVMSGNMELLELLIQYGADLNAGKMPPLTFAIVRGDKALVELLLKNGARAQDGQSEHVAQEKPELSALLKRHAGTEWHAAVKSGDLVAVTAALDAGAEIDVEGEHGRTALQLAILGNHIELALLLLERGGDPVRDNGGMSSPLHLAAGRGMTELAKQLVAQGARPNKLDRFGTTPAWLALQSGHVETFRALAELGAKYGLVEAAALGESEKVLAGLDAGESVNQANLSGATLLHAAARHANIPLLLALIERGAELEKQMDRGSTPLMEAVNSESVETVETLLKAGATINAVTGDFGNTALRLAIMRQSAPVVEVLLAHGADVHLERPKLGGTPLFDAVGPARSSIEIVELLLKVGADPNVTMMTGETPLVHLLTSAETIGKLPEFQDWGKPSVEVVRLLLRHGASPNSMTAIPFPKSALALAKEHGWSDVVAALEKAGATPEPTLEAPDESTPGLFDGAKALQEMIAKRRGQPRPYLYDEKGEWIKPEVG